MTAIEIKRISRNSVHPTFGVLLHGGLPFAVTLENPWKNNRRSVSCIPDGNYTCQRVESPRFGNTFEILDVEGRSHILFHKGNIVDDTHGCIIVGESFDYLQGENAVLSSGHAFKEFMDMLYDQDKFSLVISNHYDGGLIRG